MVPGCGPRSRPYQAHLLRHAASGCGCRKAAGTGHTWPASSLGFGTLYPVPRPLRLRAVDLQGRCAWQMAAISLAPSPCSNACAAADRLPGGQAAAWPAGQVVSRRWVLAPVGASQLHAVAHAAVHKCTMRLRVQDFEYVVEAGVEAIASVFQASCITLPHAPTPPRRQEEGTSQPRSVPRRLAAALAAA